MQRGDTPDTSSLEPSLLKRRRSRSAATVEAETKSASSRSRSRARPDNLSDSVDTFSSTGFICTGPEADSPQARSDGYKHPRIDISQHRSRSSSRQQSVEATSTAGRIPPTNTFTNVTIPDMIDDDDDDDDDDDNNNNNNNNNNGGGEHRLFTSDRMRQKMQLNLTRFLAHDLDFIGILREVVQPVRKFFTIRLNHKPYNDWNVDSIEFSRAFDHWESLIERYTASSSVTQSPLEDFTQLIADKETSENHVAMLHSLGSRSHIDFAFEIWNTALAMFFQGLSPLPLQVLVNRLKVVNRPLYNTVLCSE
ncbi:hypothetical protein AA0119_g13207 [Alternaria tenuissima]|uniref:Uncharacterized protein n=1 Tax=Alternaria tenuissima TaxID=119927 RepID=A0A4Q4QNW7_9PLEO|nr:hypothetical protein AA0115_g13052 [Alternaria tenuissima]RYN20540.1 hypothetical protein AA0114_g12968 [Alternaria tenuissima]RYN85698.1 hypothetical protein AA0119_g13207 [Alternaria tenuissima]RYO00270.1 hypothetical protein AA0121_g13415 [Alternaria tenuissima]RYO45134.1 hypothetical protein AA0116_g13392 [Alternaria tenuissima]